MELVQQLLERSAERVPDKVALICDGQRLTYAQIDASANRLAQFLKARTLPRGGRVVIHLPNSSEAVIAIFGVLKAGGTFVVINHSMKHDKLSYVLNDCQAHGLITSDRHTNGLAGLQQEAPSLAVTVLTGVPAGATPSEHSTPWAWIMQEYPPERPPTVGIDLDLACLIYTSGSTGKAKGVMSDHNNVTFAAHSIVEYLQNREDDIILNVLPLSFDYGLYQVLMAFTFGGTVVLEKGFSYPAAILRRMEEERVTGFPGVPTIFAMLLRMDTDVYDLSSLRYITNTAAALPPGHVLQLHRRFPWVRIYSMYGLTETKRTLYLPPEELDARPGSVGKAIPGTEVWLEDETGNRLGPGQVGELVVRGRHVMRGYWGDPAATAARFRPGPIPGERFCYTGDLFRCDADGYFYFVSRMDDIIKSRGEKVAPKEIEGVLYEMEGVREAAVVGVPDPILGQAIKAYVVMEDSALSEGEVLAHCRARLEDFMIPRYVEFVSELPKTASGKIRKTALVRMIATGEAVAGSPTLGEQDETG